MLIIWAREELPRPDSATRMKEWKRELPFEQALKCQQEALSLVFGKAVVAFGREIGAGGKDLEHIRIRSVYRKENEAETQSGFLKNLIPSEDRWWGTKRDF